MRNVKYYRWNNEMGSERAEERGERKAGRGANEAPLFDISYSTFFRSSDGGGDELNYKHGMEEDERRAALLRVGCKTRSSVYIFTTTLALLAYRLRELSTRLSA